MKITWLFIYTSKNGPNPEILMPEKLPLITRLLTMGRGSLISIIGIKRAINFVTTSACQFHETNIKLIFTINDGMTGVDQFPLC